MKSAPSKIGVTGIPPEALRMLPLPSFTIRSSVAPDGEVLHILPVASFLSEILLIACAPLTARLKEASGFPSAVLELPAPSTSAFSSGLKFIESTLSSSETAKADPVKKTRNATTNKDFKNLYISKMPP